MFKLLSITLTIAFTYAISLKENFSQLEAEVEHCSDDHHDTHLSVGTQIAPFPFGGTPILIEHEEEINHHHHHHHRHHCCDHDDRE